MIDPNTSDALQQMARHVAAQLVADALKDMAGSAVSVTIQPRAIVGQGIVQAPRLLGPAPSPRRGRKPGRKVKAKSKRWTAEQRSNFARTMAARQVERAIVTDPPKRKIGRPRKTAPTAEARCTRCDHTQGEHDAETGKCLSFRCVCAGFSR